jgi:hypothetical protein
MLKEFTEINDSRSFHGAIPGHFVQYGNLAEARAELLEQKIRSMVKEIVL